MIPLLLGTLSALADVAPDPGCDCSTAGLASSRSTRSAAFGGVALALGLVLLRRRNHLEAP